MKIVIHLRANTMLVPNNTVLSKLLTALAGCRSVDYESRNEGNETTYVQTDTGPVNYEVQTVEDSKIAPPAAKPSTRGALRR